jgi:hypothetical protein
VPARGNDVKQRLQKGEQSTMLTAIFFFFGYTIPCFVERNGRFLRLTAMFGCVVQFFVISLLAAVVRADGEDGTTSE